MSKPRPPHTWVRVGEEDWHARSPYTGILRCHWRLAGKPEFAFTLPAEAVVCTDCRRRP